jgi:hypothetical protein
VIELDERVVGPQPLAQFLPRDDVTRAREQRDQNLERLSIQPNSRAALPQLARFHVELEYAEREPCPVAWPVHVSSPTTTRARGFRTPAG